jgi:hypothetical protein
MSACIQTLCPPGGGADGAGLTSAAMVTGLLHIDNATIRARTTRDFTGYRLSLLDLAARFANTRISSIIRPILGNSTKSHEHQLVQFDVV